MNTDEGELPPSDTVNFDTFNLQIHLIGITDQKITSNESDKVYADNELKKEKHLKGNDIRGIVTRNPSKTFH